jgi:hypothetical protein
MTEIGEIEQCYVSGERFLRSSDAATRSQTDNVTQAGHCARFEAICSSGMFIEVEWCSGFGFSLLRGEGGYVS